MTTPRSPELMSRDDTTLLVIDMQERLVPAVRGPERLCWNVGRLLAAAGVLGLQRLATEQSPGKLGPTLPELARELPGDRPAKVAFSCRGCVDGLEGLLEGPRRRVLLAGIETHVCVQQTALDLVAAGLRVYVAVDAVSSRFLLDHETALRRMESGGVTLTTVEAAMFEWVERADSPEFKQISALAKQQTEA